MTRTPWKMGSWMLLAPLLFSLPAAARSGDCERACKKDVKDCQDICKKYAGSGAKKCTQACQNEEKTCVEECKSNEKGSR
ncbi:hypothetical protein [Archangium sp.]|uniref:hypothetical protein n=1 Tax=Archangium sp. TaxID=1872627 RepID=UPI002D4E5898|nr:hypothetical protein [Archangium sp.]HYO57626.1 hypothetical protein [Archangium sp.]